jgi:hypothetical protein
MNFVRSSVPALPPANEMAFSGRQDVRVPFIEGGLFFAAPIARALSWAAGLAFRRPAKRFA